MTVLGSHNLLTRRLAVFSPTLTTTQLQMDAALNAAQELTGDWKTAALALAAPLVISRLSSVFRNAAFSYRMAAFSEATFVEAGAGVLARTSSFAKWGRVAGTTFGMGALLAACGGNEFETGSPAPPRTLEVQGSEYSVTPSASTGTNQGFAATLNTNGQLAVTWADYNPSNPNPSAVNLRVFSASGNPSSAVEIERPPGAVSLSPSISNDEAGNILAAWTNSMGPDSPSGVRARRYSAGAQAQGNSFPIVPLENHMPPIMGTVALNPDRSFIVVSNENSSDCGVCVRTYGADNIQRSVQTLSEAHVSVLASDLARNSQGDWAWAGLLADNNGGRSVRFRYFNNGTGLRPAVTVPIGNPGAGTGIKIAVLPNDHSLVVWQSSQGLRGMVFAADGSTLSSQISLNSLPPGFSFSATSDETGAFVVAWEEGSTKQIHASLLASDGRIISDNINISGTSSNNHEVVVTGNEGGHISFVWRRFQPSPAGYTLAAKNYQIRY